MGICFGQITPNSLPPRQQSSSSSDCCYCCRVCFGAPKTPSPPNETTWNKVKHSKNTTHNVSSTTISSTPPPKLHKKECLTRSTISSLSPPSSCAQQFQPPLPNIGDKSKCPNFFASPSSSCTSTFPSSPLSSFAKRKIAMDDITGTIINAKQSLMDQIKKSNVTLNATVTTSRALAAPDNKSTFQTTSNLPLSALQGRGLPVSSLSSLTPSNLPFKDVEKKKVTNHFLFNDTLSNTVNSTIINSNQSQSSTNILTNQYSTPSHIPTARLTDIYVVPTDEYPSLESVHKANGFVFDIEIGKGSFATVYKVIRSDQSQPTPLACKVIEIGGTGDLDCVDEINDDNQQPTNAINLAKKHKKLPKITQAQMNAVKNELFSMERLSKHPHVIQLYRHFIIQHKSQSRRLVYILMQWAAGGSLSAYTRKHHTHIGLSECETKRMFAQIVTAVAYMHLKGIAHRDLKLGNVLLDEENNCLVTDFGLSRVATRRIRPQPQETSLSFSPTTAAQGQANKKIIQTSHHYCGTVPYMAPEILLTKDYDVEYNPFYADIWALGIVLYTLLCRTYPFNTKNSPASPRQGYNSPQLSISNDTNRIILEQQLSGKPIQLPRERMQFTPNDALIDLIQSLLNPHVEKRIKINALCSHRWLVDELKAINMKISNH